MEVVPMYCTVSGLLLVIAAIAFVGFVIWLIFFRKQKKIVDHYNPEITEDKVEVQTGPTYQDLLKENLGKRTEVEIIHIDPTKGIITISFRYPGAKAKVIKTLKLTGFVVNEDVSVPIGKILISVRPTDNFLKSVPKNGEIDWPEVLESYCLCTFFANPQTNLFK